MKLMEHQKQAIEHLGQGKVLWGGVGSGKTATILGYYMEKEEPRDILVITTAKKRDSLDWEREAAKFGISTDPEATCRGAIVVDSWNNIPKWTHAKGWFVVFDEQRLVGSGAWTQAFLKIAKNNRWVVLSATPGDVWMDYAAIFTANGWFQSVSEFKRQHVMYEAWAKFPKIKGYIGERRLEKMRNEILVEMPYLPPTERVVNYIECDYDKALFDNVWKKRWNHKTDEPVRDIAEMFRLCREICNSDPSRLEMVRKLLECHERIVIFYNFNYELDILRTLHKEIPTYEWNGHRKDELPETGRWVYLVQYQSGSEGWNCTSTDAMVLYSLTYSYKNHTQCMGRIDRMDTKYERLYYYLLVCNSQTDLAIREALGAKQNFNERVYALKGGIHV